jgi:hypothetical protein
VMAELPARMEEAGLPRIEPANRSKTG